MMLFLKNNNGRQLKRFIKNSKNLETLPGNKLQIETTNVYTYFYICMFIGLRLFQSTDYIRKLVTYKFQHNPVYKFRKVRMIS